VPHLGRLRECSRMHSELERRGQAVERPQDLSTVLRLDDPGGHSVGELALS
jgi:hypothetical protein